MIFSICIPSYNKIDVILRTLESVIINIEGARQLNCEFEFIIIDDNSNDGSVELLEKNIKKYNFRLFKNQENLGLVKNWNECIRKSSGEYILILHADDFLAPGALASYICYIKENPSAKFIHSNAIDIILPFLKIHTRKTQNKKILLAGDEAVKKIFLDNNLACSTVIINRDCYNMLGVFDEKAWVSPDWEMWARIGAKYDLHHLNIIGACVTLNGHNTHVSGISISIFKEQQLFYIDKIVSYLKLDVQIHKKIGLHNLNKTILNLAISYFMHNMKDVSKDYFKSANISLFEISFFKFRLFKRYFGNFYKKIFFKKKNISEAILVINEKIFNK